MGQQESFKNKKVISFSGKIASGKDTLANALQINLKNNLNVNFEIISFGYFLKDELKDFIDNLYFDERILSNIFQISIDDVKKCKEFYMQKKIVILKVKPIILENYYNIMVQISVENKIKIIGLID